MKGNYVVKIRKIFRNMFLLAMSKYSKRKIIVGYREFCGGNRSRKALLSYLVHPLIPAPSFRDRVMFSNRGIAQEIPRVLNELGFLVDIINFDNVSWKPSQEYDLFVGHGGINYEKISRDLPDSTIRVFFSTGIYWKEWNIRMAERLYDLALRKAYLLPPERFVKYSEEYANRIADGIICLGNQEAVRSYSQFPKVIGINNGVYPINWEGWRNKDYDGGREHFLFFSGRGNVHKGLDLLLEAFAQTKLHLHICQYMQNEFMRLYEPEIMHCANIHLHSFLKMRSREFENLAARCNWVISPTCVEGQPGAVLECMAYGLIPILPDSANIDLEDWGVKLRDCQVETIRAIAIQVSGMNIRNCHQMSVDAIKAIKEKYSQENFRANFRKAVGDILDFAGRRRDKR